MQPKVPSGCAWFDRLTQLLHELVVVFIAVNLPGPIESHGCKRFCWLQGTGDNRVTENAHWPSFIPTPSPCRCQLPPSTLTLTELAWRMLSFISLIICLLMWPLKCRVIAARPRGRAHKWAQGPSLLWIWHSWTLLHCSAGGGKKTKARAVCLAASGSHSAESLSVPHSGFSLSGEFVSCMKMTDW